MKEELQKCDEHDKAREEEMKQIRKDLEQALQLKKIEILLMGV